MSIARHHAEWLSLVEASGPFLSLPVLLEVFPSGLEAHEPEVMRRLKLAHEEWQDNQQGVRPDLAIHRAWVEFVLKELLEFPDEVLKTGQEIPSGLQVRFEEHQETLRPDWVIVNPTGTEGAGKPRLLVQVLVTGQDLEKGLRGSRWAASPATRMMELLHAADMRLGLLTNGEHWMLVNAPKGETTGYISWYATLWQEEKITLQAFRSLLGVGRFFGVEDTETLEAMLAKSVNSQQEVTDQLGYQVRKAVEVLVQSIDRIDQDRNRSLLKGVMETRLYEAALTVMMRLVFLFSAEERKLIPPHENAFYDTYYAVSTLRSRLREEADQFGEEILERKHDAWCRLLATFRAVHGGIDHDALFIPAYGGSLFDPDRFPFLEGREEGTCWLEHTANPIPINNRTVLHLLEALQILQIKVPGGGVEPRKLSFRALDIEQIGHVYEGLLDHTAVRAMEPILGLEGTKEKEPELPLAQLEKLWEKGDDALLEFLKKETGRSLPALKQRIPPRSPNSQAEQGSKDNGSGTPDKRAKTESSSSQTTQRLLMACNNDRTLFDRVLPWAQLIRLDTFDYPVVVPEGSVFVTQGSDRRQTGTHYTPRNLTEEIVQYTLEPLVYEGVAEGKPKEEWKLRSPQELLSLKICDMAMGSGAFLVQTCRYLAERLVEAWEAELGTVGVGEPELPGEPKRHKPIHILPSGALSMGEPGEAILPADSDERLLVARRIVADRCLYGVDKNPLAVEMAKLSLWLVTLAQGRPFTFLNHALKWGDSLLGITRAEQIEYLHLNPDNEAVQLSIASDKWRPILQDAIAKRRKLESFSVNGIEDLQEKERLFEEAEQAIARLRFMGDYLIGRALADAGKTSDLTTEDLMVVSQRIEQELAGTATEEQTRDITALKAGAERMLNLGNPANQPTRKPFHWLLEFPEVFLEGETKGFAAIVGNPPFIGGRLIGGILGEPYRDFLSLYRNGRVGSADICVYFLLQGFCLIQNSGCVGLITTNSIADTGNRTVGLEQVISIGGFIYSAVSQFQWIGTASVTVSLIHIIKGSWLGSCTLDGISVKNISGGLDALSQDKKVNSLKNMSNKNSQGMSIMGEGFILSENEKNLFIKARAKNSEVIFGYFNGSDLNSLPYLVPRRWIINFGNMDIEEAQSYKEPFEWVERNVKPYRDGLSGQIHEHCFWKFWDRRPRLQEQLKEHSQLLASAVVTKYICFQFVPTSYVYNHKVKLFFFYEWSDFSVLQSSIHTSWAEWRSGTLRSEWTNYSVSEALETFPLPDLAKDESTALEMIGNKYHSFRVEVMQKKNQGLTQTYNRFHDPNEMAEDIQKLRALHIEMDQAVAAAYGWQDLDLGHDFHPTKQGTRFTISETARREVLDRLLELNHQRYAEEVAQGLHDKKKAKGKGQKAKGKTSKKQQPDAESDDQQLKLL